MDFCATVQEKENYMLFNKRCSFIILYRYLAREKITCHSNRKGSMSACGHAFM